MFPRLHFLAMVATALFAVSSGPVAAQITVAQDGHGDFNGTDEKPLLAALAEARAKKGGEIVIGPGVYVINRSLELKAMCNVILRGRPGAVLKLAPLQHAEVASDVAMGATELPLTKQQGITTDTLVQVQANGAVDAFSGKPKPTFYVKLAKVENDRFILKEPLAFPVPAKTRLVNENAPNLLELRNGSENIVIEGLVIDGGRVAGDPPIRAHAQSCGVFASGAYSYTEGPTGKPVRGLTIRDCTIRNCFGRGVAFYSVADAIVQNCRIEDTADEAIDLDHFTVNARVLDNQVARCRVGVEMNDANECWVVRNRFEECETGVIVWRWCKMEDLNVRNQVLDNLILNIAGNALQFDRGTADNIARGNIIRGTKRNGVSLNGSSTMLIGNLIEETALHGIVVSGEENEISGNRVSGAGAGAAQKVAGLRVVGSRNRVMDNVVRDGESKAQPVSDEGRENEVR